ncbi:hypothetical protein M4951_00225 [Blastopirellula sp. J2-11]|uniref:hypothetical protein n=1 Tax=Blastopirellula sp. J2-11 TaxID=2943192 RepID=UPI0021C98BF4|nr:hypothetical protein [Blastopirellula sp. J2-11]UUO06755.1 hypothetical protein M4951_00225 [Blastopirellula sp. J2-11]
MDLDEIDETPQHRPPRELVFWTVLFQITSLAYVGFRIGASLRQYLLWGESMVPMISVPISLVVVVIMLYRSVFWRDYQSITWILPLVFGIIWLSAVLSDVPTLNSIMLTIVFILLARLVYLEYRWQQYLLKNSVPPRSGFTVWDMMMAIVGISIVLAAARYILSDPWF